MKKTVVIAFILCVAVINFITAISYAEKNPTVVKQAIAMYKNKNYLGCISSLKDYVEQDPSSAVAYYYLGNSYMSMAMKPEAHEAFDKVVTLNVSPQLTSYAIQAKACMDNALQCTYQHFTKEQILSLIANPNEFLQNYYNGSTSSNENLGSDPEIDKLINNKYVPNNLHPDVIKYMYENKSTIQNSRSMNTTPTKDEIIAAIDVLNRAGISPQNSLSGSNSFAMYLPNQDNSLNNLNSMLLYNQNTNNTNMTPEMMQLMMTQMMNKNSFSY